jgi:hypothetical protein
MIMLILMNLNFEGAAQIPDVSGRVLWPPNVSGNLNQMNPKAGMLE